MSDGRTVANAWGAGTTTVELFTVASGDAVSGAVADSRGTTIGNSRTPWWILPESLATCETPRYNDSRASSQSDPKARWTSTVADSRSISVTVVAKELVVVGIIARFGCLVEVKRVLRVKIEYGVCSHRALHIGAIDERHGLRQRVSTSRIDLNTQCT